MKRKIIKIDESLCNGCGDCTKGCAEGALQIVNGKAKLVKEEYCDGLGDCLGTCPTGALTIEEREAKDFDIESVKEHLLKTAGEEGVSNMLKSMSQKEHPPKFKGCPGLQAKSFDKKKSLDKVDGNSQNVQVFPSELSQWPVQLHLVPTKASFFEDREMVVMNTCGGMAAPDIHWRYIRGRSVVVACPKLDKTEPYREKLGKIFSENNITSVKVVIMEVPCCQGLASIVKDAISLSSREDLNVEIHTLTLQGALKSIT